MKISMRGALKVFWTASCGALLLAMPARAYDDPNAPRPKWGFIDHAGAMVITPE